MELNPPATPLFHKDEPRISIAPIPGSIVKALVQVQSHIKKLAKGEANTFAGYNFTSVDQIYDLVGDLLADAGLVILPIELSKTEMVIVETEKGPKQWAHFHKGFILATEQATWFDPRSSQSLFIKIEGPQTFHAAESYMQKTFLRSTFKIPTGEADLDAEAGKDDVRPEPVNAPKAKKLSVEESAKQRSKALEELGTLGTPYTQEVGKAFAEKWGPTLETLVAADAAVVRTQFKKQGKA